jgi:hypothetical protein
MRWRLNVLQSSASRLIPQRSDFTDWFAVPRGPVAALRQAYGSVLLRVIATAAPVTTIAADYLGYGVKLKTSAQRRRECSLIVLSRAEENSGRKVRRPVKAGAREVYLETLTSFS